MTVFDPRLTPARPDLAAAHLRGLVEAPRFVEGRTLRVVHASAPLRRAPASHAPLDTEALCGERVTVYDNNGEGWCWGQLADDGYVGWLPDEALGPLGAPVTHRVQVLRTFVYPGPSIKLAPRDALSLNSRVSVVREEGDFAVTESGGFLWRNHLALLLQHEPDFVAVAEQFIGIPYLWGGRSSLGLDCSGLVQLALAAAGRAAPRDTDMQERELGQPLEDGAPPARGDLVFWKGHVGIMRDPDRLLHANGHHMRVVTEPLRDAIARIEAKGAGKVTSVRRLERSE
jgi:cell wall-associated NlpC family hydrolase